MSDMEKLLARISEARECTEYAEECLQNAEQPSVEDAGLAWVSINAAADILEQLEKDITFDLMRGAA